MPEQNWTALHDSYSTKEWATRPSLFAETVKSYIPTHGALLELGAGLGQDSAYFASLGYSVTATDLKTDRLQRLAGQQLTVKSVDLRAPLPFENEIFDIVYAHLSLHYFDTHTTKQIFNEIYRVLRTNGVLAFFTNSTHDPEYKTGRQIEADYLEIAGVFKRYFTVESAQEFAHAFTVVLVDNQGETYKDNDKGVHNLIRYIGRKK